MKEVRDIMCTRVSHLSYPNLYLLSFVQRFYFWLLFKEGDEEKLEKLLVEC